jgi:hypothetical protein
VAQVVSAYQDDLPRSNPLMAAVAEVKLPAVLRPYDLQRLLAHDAVRADLIRMLRVLHHALGGTDAMALKIEDLRGVGSGEFERSVRARVSELQRNVIASAAAATAGMQRQVAAGLWGLDDHDEAQLVRELSHAKTSLHQALAQFDAGQTEAALQLYSQTLRHHQGQLAVFSSAADLDFYLRFTAGAGVVFTAGVAAIYTGGASLYGMTGSASVTSATGIGSFGTSLLVGGATFVGTEKFLNHQIQGIPYFKSHGALENTLEFVEGSLKAAALMGYVRGFSQLLELPVYTGAGATAVNFSTQLGREFVGLTSFTAVTDGPAQALAPESMSHGLAMLLGLKAGGATMAASARGLRHTPQALRDFGARFTEMAAPYPLMAAIRLAPGRSSPVSAQQLLDMILDHSQKPAACNQRLGVEIEFDPHGMGRDQVYVELHRGYADSGHQPGLVNGGADFVFPKTPQATLGLFTEIAMGTDYICAEVVKGAGATVVWVGRAGGDCKTGAAPRGTKSVFDATATTHAVLARFLNLPGVTAETMGDYLKAHAQVTHKASFMAKDTSGDTMILVVEPAGPGKMRLTGQNAEFHDSQGGLQKSIVVDITRELSLLTPEQQRQHPELRAVDAYLRRVMTEGPFARKVQVITGLMVPTVGIGHFMVVNELPPGLESTTPVMQLREINALRPMVDVFQRLGFSGTSDGLQVGMHVHAELPRTVATATGTAFSVGPALQVMRAVAQYRHLLYELFPSHPNRRPYIQPMLEAHRQLLLDPRYIANPTDVQQILRFVADTAKYQPRKYGEVNMDNFNAALLDEMGRAGKIKDGQNFVFSAKGGNGRPETYVLHVAFQNGQYKVFRDIAPGEVVSVAADGHELRAGNSGETVEITRVSADALKPTVELRMPDTVIDQTMIVTIARFWAAFVHKFANH